MSELLEKVERIEKILLITWKLAKAVMRGHNKSTKIFNDNFDVFEDKVSRNATNIDKMVNTLQELMGNESIKVEDGTEQLINRDCKRIYL